MEVWPRLPAGFQFGVATAAYQIEGGVDADGRGRSVWDTFSHTPGRTRDGDTGDVACDSYHRYPQDVALIAGLGAQAYRFSVAWPRVQPDGRGAVNRPGLDYYSRLVDALLEVGIEPVVTLFHWDLPQALEDAGGWLNRGLRRAVRRLRRHRACRPRRPVPTWITLDEPFVHTTFGYGWGTHAPGRRLGLGALVAAHHPAARPRAGRPGAACRRAARSDRDHQRLHSRARRLRRAGGRRRRRALRRRGERLLQRPGAAWPLPGRVGGAGTGSRPLGGARRRPGRHHRPAGLPRHQLLLPNQGCGPRPAATTRWARIGCPSRAWSGPRSTGRSCPTACASCWSGCPTGTAMRCPRST